MLALITTLWPSTVKVPAAVSTAVTGPLISLRKTTLRALDVGRPVAGVTMSSPCTSTTTPSLRLLLLLLLPLSSVMVAALSS